MQELFDLFERLDFPYFRQGSLTDETYPNSFFTFWNIDTPNISFYDNKDTKHNEIVNVCFYTNDPNLIYNVMEDFITAAKAVGFIVVGHAKDAPADKENYYGRYVTINIIHSI